MFQALGGEVVQQAMAGFNTSVFAYGQTGAGKSYSMMGGKGDDRGLIPRICEGMFSAGTAASPGAGPPRNSSPSGRPCQHGEGQLQSRS